MAGLTVREAMWDERREWIRKQRESGLSVAVTGRIETVEISA